MGTVESKFCHLLATDSLGEALRLWQSSEPLRKLSINTGLSGSRNKDPPLHCLLRHGNYRCAEIKELLQIFLDKGADPLCLNSNNETALHILCCSQRQGARENRARCGVLEILLQRLPNCDDSSRATNKTAKAGGIRKLTKWLAMQDNSQNTALHLAAASGLLDCVELLLAYGAPLFLTNIAKKTAMESAADAKQMIIAQFLESQMVISDEKGSSEDFKEALPVKQKQQSFYNPDQLKAMQEELVRKVSEELKIVPDAARALLSSYSWSHDLVIEAWKKNKADACTKAGLDLAHVHNAGGVADSLSQKSCEICFEAIPEDEKIDVPCGHHFCRECWASYLEVSVKEGGGKDISCPGHDCSTPVPMAIIAKLVSDELYRKYSDLNVQHFVDSNKDFKWCPYPGCNQAVMKGEVRASAPVLGKQHGINVECGNGHGFCWNCNKHAHEPCECEVWEKWLHEISKMAAEGNVDMSKIAEQAEADAQWIISNTKPCPSCTSPIQKTEGCNHMTCRKCYHDFCWVCLDPWNEHSYRTGGYFSCNRYNAQRRANSRVNEARSSMARQYRKTATEDAKRQLEKFTHYHERYANHLHAIQIECQILAMSQAKTRSLMSMRKVVEKKVASKRQGGGGGGGRGGSDLMASLRPGFRLPPPSVKDINPDDTENFLEGVVRVLLHSRRILATSYGIGFLIPDERKEAREAHDTLQGKLEEVVESLAQMVNRSYLNTPRAEMASRARDVDFICQEFIEVMREVVLTGLTEEPPKAPVPRPPSPDEVELDIDPLILFAHLAMRSDPQFREIFNRLMTENDDDDD